MVSLSFQNLHCPVKLFFKPKAAAQMNNKKKRIRLWQIFISHSTACTLYLTKPKVKTGNANFYHNLEQLITSLSAAVSAVSALLFQ